MGPMGPPGEQGERGPQSPLVVELELISFLISEANYAEVQDPNWRKVVRLEDARIMLWEGFTASIIGVYVRISTGSTVKNIMYVPVDNWFESQPNFNPEAYGEILRIGFQEIEIVDPNEFLLGRTVVVVVTGDDAGVDE